MTAFSKLNAQQLANFAEQLTEIAANMAKTYDSLAVNAGDEKLVREYLSELSTSISEITDLRDEVLTELGVATGIS